MLAPICGAECKAEVCEKNQQREPFLSAEWHLHFVYLEVHGALLHRFLQEEFCCML